MVKIYESKSDRTENISLKSTTVVGESNMPLSN